MTSRHHGGPQADTKSIEDGVDDRHRRQHRGCAPPRSGVRGSGWPDHRLGDCLGVWKVIAGRDNARAGAGIRRVYLADAADPQTVRDLTRIVSDRAERKAVLQRDVVFFRVMDQKQHHSDVGDSQLLPMASSRLSHVVGWWNVTRRT
jgi:hypothetical protein